MQDEKPPPWLRFAPWRWPWKFRDVAAIFGIGLISLPILGLLLPNIEESRTEARTAMAYIEVRRLAESTIAASKGKSFTLPDRDPWGQPYHVFTLNDGSIRVLSSGPNQAALANGIDGDDIYSDMPISPVKAMHRRKQQQFLFAVNVAAGSWILFSTLYLWSRFFTKPDQPPPRPVVVPWHSTGQQ